MIVPLTDYDPKPTGIKNVYSQNNDVRNEVYDLNGLRISQPQKGLNIIKMSDGRTQKVVIR